MAVAIAYAISAYAGTAGTIAAFAFTATQAFFINLAIAATISAYQADAAKKKAYKSRQASYQDRELTFRSAIAPARYIYGSDRVSGPLIDAFASGVHDEFIHLVIPLAYHECEAIDDVWFGDEKLPAPDADGFIRSGLFVSRKDLINAITVTPDSAGNIVLPHNTNAMPAVLFNASGSGDAQVATFTHTVGTNIIGGLSTQFQYTVSYGYSTEKPLIRIRKHLGRPGQVADPVLIAESNGRWDATMVGNRTAYLYVRMEYDAIFDQYGLDDIRALVRGKRLFDPRLGANVYSDNAQLVANDWITDSVFGLADESPPSGETVAGANVCDELIPVRDFYGHVPMSDFANKNLNGWTFNQATTSFVAGSLRVTSTGADPYMIRVAQANGNRHIRLLIKRVAGTGWQGECFYANALHTHSQLFKKTVPQPIYGPDGWGLLEFDMHALTAGGTDYEVNSMFEFRVDLGNSAQDVFDVQKVGLGGFAAQKRYTFNGSFTSDETPKEVLQTLMLAMHGTCVYTQGRWLVRPGHYRAPTLTIDESKLAGAVNITRKPSRKTLYNAVRATYRGPDTDYVEVQAPLVQNAQYTAEDGGQKILDVSMPMLCDSIRAQRMAKIILETARQSSIAQVTTNLRAYDVSVTDTVAMTLIQPGWAGKEFTVLKRTWGGLVEIAYDMQETSPTVWQWNNGEATLGDPAPDTNLRSPAVRPAAITGLTIASGVEHALRLSDDSVQGRVLVTWNAVTDLYVTQGGTIEVTWRQPGRALVAVPALPGDSSRTFIESPPQGTGITVMIRAVNALGFAGVWSTVGHNVQQTSIVGTGGISTDAVTVSTSTHVPSIEFHQIGTSLLFDAPIASLEFVNPSSTRPIKVSVSASWFGRASASGSFAAGDPRVGVSLVIFRAGIVVYPVATRAAAGATSPNWYADGLRRLSAPNDLDGGEAAPSVTLSPNQSLNAVVYFTNNISADPGPTATIDSSFFDVTIKGLALKR